MSERLPTVGGGTATAPTPDQGQPPGAAPDGPAESPRREPTSSIRLVISLAIAGAIAGFFIVLVHQWSQPKIQAHQARALAEAVQEVLGAPETTAQLFLFEGDFVAAPPATADTADLDRVYAGFDADGGLLGVAVVAAEPGFQDIIRLIFGFDPATGEVLGMKVLESKETPGLGDKIEKDESFVAEFAGVATPLVGVKPGAGSGTPGEIDMITGATISSKAIIDIINNRLDVLGQPLEQLAGASSVTTVAGGGS